MRISVIGTGYVGLVTGICLAELGNDVTCADRDPSKIQRLRHQEVPIYEPGLQPLLIRNAERGNLQFTTDIREAVKRSDLIFIAVGTPSLPSGEADLSHVEEAARDIALGMNEPKIIVTKSTVPVGTNHRIHAIVAGLTSFPFEIAAAPEFLREGSAVQDTLHPDRVVIGVESGTTEAVLRELYRPFTDEIVVTDIRSAEMIKYASNAFLATKISFINEIANICEKVGADVTEVAKGMGLDKRIGPAFLQAGIGYGGSCFPKDTEALIQIAGNENYNFRLLKAVVEVNKEQRFNIVRKLKETLGPLRGRTIAIWGLAFKPNTDDVRESPALEIIKLLLESGAAIRAYDPIATSNFGRLMGTASVTWCVSALDAADQADAVCLLTDWDEFKRIDLTEVRSNMKLPLMIDGRNVFTPRQMRAYGFQYYSIGRPGRSEERTGSRA